MRSTLALQPVSRSLLLGCCSSPSACSASLTMTKRISCGRRTLGNLSQFFFSNKVALQLNNNYQTQCRSAKGAKPGSSVVFDLSSLRVVRGVEILSTSHQFKLPSHHRLDVMENIMRIFHGFPRSSDCTDAVSSFSYRTLSIVIVSSSMCGFLTWRFRIADVHRPVFRFEHARLKPR